MQEDDLKQMLMGMGFSRQEAAVYLYIFRKGTVTVSQMVRELDVPRSTIYVVLDRFRDSGIVSYVEAKPHRKYTIESPQRILDFIKMNAERRAQEIALAKVEQENAFQNSINRFVNEQNTERPKVLFYEGVRGLGEINEDIVKTNPKEIFGMYDWDIAQDDLSRNKKVVNKKQKVLDENFKMVSIYTSNEKNKRPSVEDNIKRYYIEEEIKGEISIYGNKVALIDRTSMSLLVENPNIVQTLKTLFKLALKGINKK